MGLNARQFKMIFFASIGMDLMAIFIIIAFSGPLAGLLVAAMLALGEYLIYWLIFKPLMTRESALEADDGENAPPRGPA